AGLDVAERCGARFAQQNVTRCERLTPGGVADLLQPLRICEVGKRQLSESGRLAVREAGKDNAFTVDADARQAAGGETILRKGVHAERVTELRGGSEVHRHADVGRAGRWRVSIKRHQTAGGRLQAAVVV